jgi:hypothetical protein
MLPDFPRSKKEIRKQLVLLTERMEREKAPLLAGIKSFTQHEGRVHSYDRIRADPVSEGFEEIAIPVTIELSEMPDLVGEKLVAKIEAMADQLARKRMEMFYRKFTEVTREVGNSFDAQGAPLTQDMVFEMLERIDMEFGPDNRPTFTFNTTPELAKVFERWQDDPCFKVRYEELLNRKRDAWRDRESNRKLVD